MIIENKWYKEKIEEEEDETLIKDFEKAAIAIRERFNGYCENDETPIDVGSANAIAKKAMVIVNEILNQNGFQKYLVHR